MAGHFQLDKWYLDAIREDGSGIILYDASLRWKFFRLHYYNRLEFDANGESRNSVSLMKRLKMATLEKEVFASDKQVEGTWRSELPAICEELLKTEKGAITWNCFYPNCQIALDIRGVSESARGYAEQLFMTLDPWKFDIDELYWGRFCSADFSIVWIEWRGAISKKWLYLNGHKIDEFQLTNEMLICEKFSLDLSNKKMIRTGSLLNSVFKSFRWLRHIFPGKTMFSDETKWRAAAELIVENKSYRGFSIFEKVLWVK